MRSMERVMGIEPGGVLDLRRRTRQNSSFLTKTYALLVCLDGLVGDRTAPVQPQFFPSQTRSVFGLKPSSSAASIVLTYPARGSGGGSGGRSDAGG